MSSYNKMFDGDSKYEEAEFNLAVGTVIRINEKLKELNFYFQIGDFPNAFRVEQILFNEISPFIRKESEDKYNKEVERESKIEEEMNVCYVAQRDGKKQFCITKEMDHKLRTWDRDIRFYLMKYKLYMKMQDTRLAAARI